MSELTVSKKIKQLPPEAKRQVQDFICYWISSLTFLPRAFAYFVRVDNKLIKKLRSLLVLNDQFIKCNQGSPGNM